MKLNKHMDLFVKVLTRIVSRSTTKKFSRGELCQYINRDLANKHMTINRQHLSQIVKRQDKFDLNNTRSNYEFKEKDED